MKNGVYILFRRKKVVYIGKTTQWPIRLAAHKSVDFTDARIIECEEDSLNTLEGRLIQIFNPKENVMHTPKLTGCKITDDWVFENSDLILNAMRGDILHKAVLSKAVEDLGYSPRHGSTDFMGVVVRRYERMFNVSYDWNNKEIKV